MKRLIHIIPILLIGLIFLGESCKEEGDSSSDTVPPEITILGPNPIYTAKDSVYADSGAIAIDDVDGDITDRIETTNLVDIHQVGEYQVIYRVADKAGNLADTFRVVKVMIF